MKCGMVVGLFLLFFIWHHRAFAGPDIRQDPLTSLEAAFQRLKVDRGETPDSRMITTAIEFIVSKNTIYKFIAGQGLHPFETLSDEMHLRDLQNGSNDRVPEGLKWVEFRARWIHEASEAHEDRCDSNILGGNGRLIIEGKNQNMNVPVVRATEELLNYYGAHLLQSGDCFRFQNQREFPIFQMEIGRRYLDDFIMKKGGGFYLEYHNEPHYHEPMDTCAGGTYLLAKELDHGRFRMTAFSIPYGTAVYTEPNALHDDAPTVGRWRVGYTDAKEFSTVILETVDSKIVNLSF